MLIPLDSVRRARLIWIGRLGDVLISTPFMASLRVRFPQARITLVTGEKGQSAARLCPDVDEVLVLRPFYRALANLSLAASLAAQEDDLLIDLNTAYSRSSIWLARLARSRAKVAFSRGRGDGAFRYLLPAAADTEHMLDRYGRLAQALGAPYEPRLRARVPASDYAAADELLAGLRPDKAKRLVLIHPGNFKKFDNRWPEEKFAALTEHIQARSDAEVLYLAGPGEESAVRAIVSGLKRPVPVVGPLSIGVTAALLSRVDLAVLNATGTAHLAAAVGAPTLTFLGRYTHTVWMPRNDARHLSVVSPSWESCRDISVADACAAFDRAFESLPRAAAERPS